MEAEAGRIGALGEIFHFTPDLHAWIAEDHFFKEFYALVSPTREFLKYYDSLIFTGAQKQVGEVLMLLFPAFTGLYREFVWRNGSPAEGHETVQAVTYTLGRLILVFLWPEKPTGFLARSNNMKLRQKPWGDLAGLQRSAEILQDNFRRLNEVPTLPNGELEVLEMGAGFAEAAANRMKGIKDFWDDRPRMEWQCYEALVERLGKTRAENAIDALIQELLESGCAVRPNARKWLNRVQYFERSRRPPKPKTRFAHLYPY